MRKQMLLAAGLLLAAAPVLAQQSWLTAGEAAYRILRRDMPELKVRASSAALAPGVPASERIYLLHIKSHDIPRLSRLLHGALKHCGGFMQHPDEGSARYALARHAAPADGVDTPPSYEIGNQALVVSALASMQEQQIAQSIQDLSALPDRFYSSTDGARASVWLQEAWSALAGKHGNSGVALFAHAGYGQASVIATIAGSDLAGEVIVLGAHLDSINVSLAGNKGGAPGADDDASGVASLTEVFRVMAETRYAPRRTIKLIAYAAEEVGLRGSQDIARSFKQSGTQVVGVLQLDMTNFKGSSKDLYLFSDYTDAGQNSFLARLIETYLPTLTVGIDRCGYACSDHASWQALGFRTSMPFESALAQDNPHIHSKRDTYANSGSQAAHALKFARLAAAYAIELGSPKP